MMRFFGLVLLLVFSSCGTGPAADKPVHAWYNGDKTDFDSITPWFSGWTGSGKDSMPFVPSRPDCTLALYASRDSFWLFLYWADWYELMELNGKKFGLNFSGEGLRIYELENKQVVQESTHALDASFMPGAGFTFRPFVKADFNFDGYTDLILRIPDYGVHGNADCWFFLFDPVSKKLKPVRGSPIENASPYADRKMIRSKHFSSVCGASGKYLYQCVDDSLLLCEEAIINACCPDPDDAYDGLYRHTVYINKEKRRDSLIVKTKAESNKAWSSFSTALWDTRKTWLDDF